LEGEGEALDRTRNACCSVRAWLLNLGTARLDIGIRDEATYQSEAKKQSVHRATSSDDH
jgi:hypothetical protein